MTTANAGDRERAILNAVHYDDLHISHVVRNGVVIARFEWSTHREDADRFVALGAELNAAKKVIESVYQQSNQPAIIAETREYLNEYGGAQ